MKRREFMALLGGAVAGWPRAVHAQATERVRRVGVLIALAESDPEAQARVSAFGNALRELGWIDGGNIRIDYRYAAADPELATTYASEMVAQGTDVILANSSHVLTAVQRETRTTPIVFAQVADPVGAGYVESVARPGGNITGFTTFEYSIAPKWLELLKEIAPGIGRVAVVRDPTFAGAAAQFGAIQALAPSLGLQVSPAGVRDAEQIERVITALAREPNVGLVVLPGPLATVHRDTVIGLALRHGLPAVYPYRYFTTRGGLISYGIDNVDLFRRAASYVNRILKGEHAGELPIQAPTKFELVINLKTARALGLTVPTTVLARADEVIE